MKFSFCTIKKTECYSYSERPIRLSDHGENRPYNLIEPAIERSRA